MTRFLREIVFGKPAIFIVVAMLMLFGVSRIVNFYVVNNDFWGCYYLSTLFSFGDISTWYNEIMPFGYTMLLKLVMGEEYPALRAFAVDASFSIIVFISLFSLASAFGYTFRTGLIAALFAALYPRMFHHICAPGPVVASAALFSAGAAMLLILGKSTDGGRRNRLYFVIAGLLFGLGGLWRYHALYAAVIFMVSYFFFYKVNFRGIAGTLAGIVLVSAPQWYITFATGHPPGNATFSYYVYNLMYSINWYHAKDVVVPTSAVNLILADPILFVKKYLLFSADILPATVFPPLLFLVVYRIAHKRGFAPDIAVRPEDSPLRVVTAAKVWSVFALAYGLLTTASGSASAVIMPLPVSSFFVAASIVYLYRSVTFSKRYTRIVVLIAILPFLVFIQRDIHKIRIWRNTAIEYASIEKAVMDRGASEAHDVFSTDFDLYFTRLKPYKPLSNGGWLKFGSNLAPGLLPDFSTSSLDTFAADCRKYGVSFVFLSANSEKAAECLGALYAHPDSDAGFKMILEGKSGRLFQIY